MKRLLIIVSLFLSFTSQAQLIGSGRRVVPGVSAEGVKELVSDKIPALTISELRSGKADTAKVINITDEGKSGIFKFSPNTNLPDDSSMVIISGGRKYIRPYEGVINPKWFGAKADGVTDDIKSISKALKFANDNSSVSEINFTEGVYLVSDVCRIVRDNLTLSGSGKAIIKLANNALKPNTNIDNSGDGMILSVGNLKSTGRIVPKNITIRNLSIDGNYSNQNPNNNFTATNTGGRGIFVVAEGITISDCEIYNCFSDGISIRRASNVLITRNKVYGNGFGGLAQFTKNGISLYGSNSNNTDSLSRGNLVESNTLFSNYDTGIAFTGASSLTISNNIIYSNKFGIEGPPEGSTSNTTNIPRDVTIIGNQILQNGEGITFNTQAVSNIIITGNKIKDCNNSAVYIQQTVGGKVVFTGNIVENWKITGTDINRHGVLFEVDDLIFSNNHVFISDKAPLGGRSFYLTRAKKAKITNNIFDNLYDFISIGLNSSNTNSNSLVDISGNTINSRVSAIVVSKAGSYSLEYLSIQNNVFTNIGFSAAGSGNNCISISSSIGGIEKVHIKNNLLSDNRGVGKFVNRGLSVSAGVTITELIISNNDFETSLLPSIDLSGTVSILNRSEYNKFNGFYYSGASANRPTLRADEIGFRYFDTDISQQIFWTGTVWDNNLKSSTSGTWDESTVTRFVNSATGSPEAGVRYEGLNLKTTGSNFTQIAFRYRTSNGLVKAFIRGNDSGTLSPWVELSTDPVKTLSATASGDGVTKVITIPHSVGAIPAYYSATALNAASGNIAYITANSSNFFINYSVAPVTGTSNLSYNISYKK